VVWLQFTAHNSLTRKLGLGRHGAAILAGATTRMHILSGFAEVSLGELALVAGGAFFGSLIGGMSGYGTGALMPLVLMSGR
jgi:hypothetical protein